MKRRMRINEDTLTTIVVLSLLFCACLVIASYVFAYKGVVTDSLLSSGLKVFGTELGICALFTLQQRYFDRKEKREAAMEQERRDARQADRDEREKQRKEDRDERKEIRNCSNTNVTIVEGGGSNE